MNWSHPLAVGLVSALTSVVLSPVLGYIAGHLAWKRHYRAERRTLHRREAVAGLVALLDEGIELVNGDPLAVHYRHYLERLEAAATGVADGLPDDMADIAALIREHLERCQSDDCRTHVDSASRCLNEFRASLVTV